MSEIELAGSTWTYFDTPGSTWKDLDDIFKKQTPEEFEEYVERFRKARQRVFGEDFSEAIFQEDVERMRKRRE